MPASCTTLVATVLGSNERAPAPRAAAGRAVVRPGALENVTSMVASVITVALRFEKSTNIGLMSLVLYHWSMDGHEQVLVALYE